MARRLADEFPGSARELCALRHESPFELLVATILSAQCTDARVNQVLPGLLARYPDPPALAAAPVDDVAELVPWLVTGGTGATMISVVVAALVSLVVGGVLSIFTGRSWHWSAVRQLLISGAAAAVTYSIGVVIGA